MSGTLDQMVSDHAAVRYFERVLEVPVPDEARNESETHKLNAICKKIGIKALDVKRQILTPSVMAAMQMRAMRYWTATHGVAFQHYGDYGVVATVLPRDSKLRKE